MHLESREDFVMEPQEATMPGTVRTLCVSISTTSLLPRFNIELTSKDNELPVERIFFFILQPMEDVSRLKHPYTGYEH